MSVEIRRMEASQIPEAKRVILSVARSLFGWEAPLERIIAVFDEHHELHDVDELQTYYFDSQGLFLVAMDEGRVVGTGAVERVDGETAELKRFWLLEEYQGKGIGYRMLQELLTFARATGYTRMRLVADRKSERAIRFYERAGFQPSECADGDASHVCMEMGV